jgi:hypothetical protein
MFDNIVLTSDSLSIIAGAVISLFFSYFPKLNSAYAGLDESYKKLIMLGALLLTVVGLYALGCVGFASIDGFLCDKTTAFQFLKMFLLAVIANQGVFKISPTTQAVLQAKQ